MVSRLSPNKNDNNVYDRTFLAGNYLKIGWPSVNIMSSSDYKCVALTDYDRFPEDIDGEGDAFSLASKRTTTFMSSGMTLVESSPGRDVKDVKWRRTSPHEAPPTTGILSLYNRGDRRRWYWPCPHCGEYFQPCGDVVAGFRDIADPVLASEAAYIQCPSCSGRIMPEQKRELNGRGVWLRDGESINADGSRYGDPRRSRIASFWMEGPAAAYQTLSQLVYKLLTAEQEYETTGSEETLKTVINTDWGLPYLPRASMEQRKSELLEQRAEPVPSRSVPDGVNFLVATVDVQAGRHRRFVVQVPAGEVLMAILDDVIGVFSPGWKAARLRSRAVIQAYEAVKTTRTHKARRENRTADQLSQYGAVSLREQARYLDNNHDLVIGVFDKLEERVVGKNGIIVEPHPVLRNGAIARDLAAEIRTRWSEWSVSPEVTGQFTRPMLERLMLRTWLRDGEVFAQMVSGRINSLTPSAGVHFWLEALEPDFIPMTSDESNRLNLKSIKSICMLIQPESILTATLI
ncbi:DNA packaging protein of prophage (terminase large subunit) [Escherichia coli]|nr:DNA packaging protein of prophage (terminase large subunit) [Escherichia coli]